MSVLISGSLSLLATLGWGSTLNSPTAGSISARRPETPSAQTLSPLLFEDLRKSLGVGSCDPLLVLKEAKNLKNQLNECEKARVAIQRKAEDNKWMHEQDLLERDLDIRAQVEEVRVLEEQLKGAQKQFTAEKLQLTTSLSDIRLKLGLANTKLLESKQTETILKAQLAEEKTLSCHLRQALQAANSKCSSLAEDLKISSQQLSDLQSKYKADKGRIQLEEQLRQAQQVSQQLQKGQATLNKRLNCMREEAAQKEKEYSRLRQSIQEEFQCSICLDRRSEVCFVPCGHMCACEVCSGPLARCPICRMKIDRKQKLFYP